MVKECSEFSGAPGDFCSIISSNLEEIAVGSKVIYAEAPGETTLDTEIMLDAGSGNVANGHVVLDLASDKGVVTLAGGTGSLDGIAVRADVTPDAEGNSHWDGTYSFD